MCRLFGFKSIINGQVHQSLIHADNALQVQSVGHPDGWGVCYYINNCPHIIKSDKSAVEDSIFKQVSGIVYSNTVIAHLRKATEGTINLLNTHPFQYGNWTFAHNGNIKNFSKLKQIILSHIDLDLKRFILGATDSEVIFFFLLSSIKKSHNLHLDSISTKNLITIVKQSLSKLTKIIGDCCQDNDCSPLETYLTFIISNGKCIIAHQGGKNLYYSTYKKKCKERDVCSHFSQICEAPTMTGKINHLILSSEPLSGDNIWIPLKFGQLIGTDEFMKLIIG